MLFWEEAVAAALSPSVHAGVPTYIPFPPELSLRPKSSGIGEERGQGRGSENSVSAAPVAPPSASVHPSAARSLSRSSLAQSPTSSFVRVGGGGVGLDTDHKTNESLCRKVLTNPNA